MKSIYLVIALLISTSSYSQVTKVSLQASGLTCSMCSNAINKALKTVNFINKIEPNIKTSTFDITFKPGTEVDFEKLKDKVEDAGFFVSKFFATVHFDDVAVKADQPVAVGDKMFQFINIRDKILTGDQQLKIIDKGFVSAKEFKKNAIANSTDVNGSRIYHVII